MTTPKFNFSSLSSAIQQEADKRKREEIGYLYQESEKRLYRNAGLYREKLQYVLMSAIVKQIQNGRYKTANYKQFALSAKNFKMPSRDRYNVPQVRSDNTVDVGIVTLDLNEFESQLRLSNIDNYEALNLAIDEFVRSDEFQYGALNLYQNANTTLLVYTFPLSL